MNLEELYQEVILDHSRRPRNFGEPPAATIHVHGDNPMCGDEVTLHVAVDGDVVTELGFTGNGCSICMASASMMTAKLRNRTKAEADGMLHDFQEMITGEEAEPPKSLGDLRLLKTVRRFPQRVKCATLPWHALRQALEADTAAESLRKFSIEDEPA